MRIKAGIERELSIVDQRVLSWVGHIERMGEGVGLLKGVDGGTEFLAGTG